MRIQLVLSDDWELRGDGSGDMRTLQFATIERLTEIYERHGIRGSFNAEIMQQLSHLRHGREHPHLLTLAKQWEDVVRSTYSRGHDVQLHVHPQWHDARYEEGRWRLSSDWSLATRPPAAIRQMLSQCKQYLESLLRPLNPDYRCVAFRSGAWSLAPSDHALPILAELGILVDMSLADGLHYDLEMVKLDYRGLDEPFLPFYPNMRDARRMAARPEPIVCVPTHSFYPSRSARIARKLAALAARRLASPWLRQRFLRPYETPTGAAQMVSSYQKIWRADRSKRGLAVYAARAMRPIKALLGRKASVSDLSALSLFEMKVMLRDIRRRAAASGWPVVPVIIENHTKDIGSFEPIERFCQLLAEQPDVEVIRASQLVGNIRSGMYEVRRARCA